MQFRYKKTLEEATRFARDIMNAPRIKRELKRCDDGVLRRVEVIEKPSYHFTLKEIRHIINCHRANSEALAVARAEHKDDPDFDYKTVLDWTECFETRAYKRKDGYPYCHLLEVISWNDLATPEVIA